MLSLAAIHIGRARSLSSSLSSYATPQPSSSLSPGRHASRRITTPPFSYPDAFSVSFSHSVDFVSLDFLRRLPSSRIQNSSRYLHSRSRLSLSPLSARGYGAWPTWEFIRRNYAYEFVLDEVSGRRLPRKFLNGCSGLLRRQRLYETGESSPPLSLSLSRPAHTLHER